MNLASYLLIKDEEKAPLRHFLLVFLVVGTGIALGRGSANTLFLKRFGIEYLPHMYLLLGVCLSISSTLYAAYADRLAPERFFTRLSYFLIFILAGCRGLMQLTTVSFAYPIYFLVFEVASELLVLHVMLYFSSNFDAAQSKRLLPLALSGILLGEVCGGYLLTLLSGELGMGNVLLVWAGVMFAAALLVQWRHARAGASLFYRPATRGSGQLRRVAEQLAQGVKFSRQSALLRHSALAVFFMVIALYILSYAVKAVYTATFRSEEELGILFGMITMVGGAIAFLVQVFFVNKWLRRFGIRKMNLAFPLTTALSFVALLVSFKLPSALFGSFNRRVLMPTVRNSSRNLLFGALPDYIQGRARALTLMLVLPLALILTGLLLSGFARFATPFWLLTTGLAASLAYLFFSLLANRAYAAALLGTLRENVFLPREQLDALTRDTGQELLDELAQGARHVDDKIALAYAKLLAHNFPGESVEILFERMQNAPPPVRDQLIGLTGSNMSEAMRNKLRGLLGTWDNHEKATLLMLQFECRDGEALGLVEECLRSDNPRLAACGIHGVLSYGLSGFSAEAMQRWKHLLRGEHKESALAGLSLFEKHPLPHLQAAIYPLLAHPDLRLRMAAICAMSRFTDADTGMLLPRLRQLYAAGDAALRAACVECYKLLPRNTRTALCFEALEDTHASVIKKALGALQRFDSDFADALVRWFEADRASPRTQLMVLSAFAEMPVTQRHFFSIATAKIAKAQSIAAATRTLPPGAANSSGIELFGIVLAERLLETIDLALLAMESLGNPHTIRVVRASLNSKDRRHIGRAIEAFDHFEPAELATPLMHLLENIGAHKPAAGAGGAAFDTLPQTLAWCAENLDPWARTCAQHVIAGLPENA
jgi:hypothetical protein